MKKTTVEIWEFENFKLFEPKKFDVFDFSFAEKDGEIGFSIQYKSFEHDDDKYIREMSTDIFIINKDGKIVIKQGDHCISLSEFGTKKEQVMFLTEVFRKKEVKKCLSKRLKGYWEYHGYTSFKQLEKDNEKERLRYVTGTMDEDETKQYLSYLNIKFFKQWINSGCVITEENI